MVLENNNRRLPFEDESGKGETRTETAVTKTANSLEDACYQIAENAARDIFIHLMKSALANNGNLPPALQMTIQIDCQKIEKDEKGGDN